MSSNSNKLGNMPVGKLLISMSLPLMISMLTMSLYNIVDGIYVSMISENALTATTLSFPIQVLRLAFAIGTAVGMNSIVSRRLGEGNTKEASNAATHGVVLTLLTSILFIVFGLFFVGDFFTLFSNDSEIIGMGTEYLTIVTLFSPFMFMTIMSERQLQSTGLVIYSMLAQGLGAITNIILDPIFIFGIDGVIPAYGITGAAIATVIGEMSSCTIAVCFNYFKNKDLRINLIKFKWNFATVKDIYRVGIPSIVLQMVGTVMTMGMNIILLRYSTTAVAMFGIYFKLQSFVFLPIFGMMQGFVSIVAYNFGAKNKQRIDYILKLVRISAVCIAALFTLVFLLFAKQLLMIFSASDEMIAIGVPALRIICLGFMPAAFSITCGTFSEGLGVGTTSLISSIMRQLVAILPLAYLFSLLFTIDFVWFAFVISEAVSLLVSYFLSKRVYNKKILPLEHQGELDEISAT